MLGMTNCRETPVWVNGHDAFSNHLQVYAEDAPIDYRTTSNASWYAIQVRRDWIQSLALTLVGRELELPARGCLNLSVSIARAWALREEMDSILKLGQRALSAHAFATTSPRIESSLMEKVIGALMQDAPRKTLLPRAIRHRCDIVKRIEHALDERQAEPFRIQRLIAQTGLKERTLQRFCQEVYGLTPRQLFGVARLNRIRQQLQSRERPTSTIRSLATASGVNHLGRFAAEYRKLFGEHPRDTLQRARYQSHPLLPR